MSSDEFKKEKIGLGMAEWYIITRDKRYLTQAEAVWNYLAQH